MFTAGRDGKDGKGPMVQSFPLFSVEFGGIPKKRGKYVIEPKVGIY